VVVTGMILAAGFGTRLAPRTGTTPKALVEADGRPMIAYAVDALRRAGVDRIVVNAHHHAERIASHFLATDYGIPVTVSVENDVLGTGGGILHARRWLEDGPFFVHNADVVSDFELGRLADVVRTTGAFAALAVHTRPTRRALVFDASNRLLGKEAWTADGVVYPDRAPRFGFCGIHCIGPAIFTMGLPVGFADVFDLYRTALDRGRPIAGVPCTGAWIDLGTEEAIRNFRAASYGSSLAGSS
jgi:NDP-sugar pyrophosphorylase family protein